MTLRDLGAYYEWLDREEPDPRAERVAAAFVLRAGREPWLAPSVHDDQFSEQPHSEVRYAYLNNSVYVRYRHWYQIEGRYLHLPLVDILVVTTTL